MRRIIVMELLTVDGVMEAPGFEEHRTGRNGWALKLHSTELGRYLSELSDVDAYLLGRKTYQIWAAFWPTAHMDERLWRRMNEITKYVVSSTLTSADWQNSILLSGDWEEQLTRLLNAPGGDLLVNGSGELVRRLIERDLVDELHLIVFPVILGSGKRLFPDGLDTTNLRLTDTRTFPNGVVLLKYEPYRDGSPPVSRFAEEFAWTGEQTRSYQAAQDVGRVLASVLFTDIVRSSELAAELGDRGWRKLLDQHDDLARAEVTRWHGRFVKHTGDGILATFETPTRALRCAFGLAEALTPLGLEIRSAIHTGEVETREDDVGGIAVHISARVLAEAGERGAPVLVTRTARDLATGTDLSFTALGSADLRGIPGSWELFEARLTQ